MQSIVGRLLDCTYLDTIAFQRSSFIHVTTWLWWDFLLWDRFNPGPLHIKLNFMGYVMLLLQRCGSLVMARLLVFLIFCDIVSGELRIRIFGVFDISNKHTQLNLFVIIFTLRC